MIRFLKKLWNRFVEGFETGVLHILFFILGLADDQGIMSLQSYLPEQYGKVFMGIAVIGILVRYFIKVGYIKPFPEESDVVPEPATRASDEPSR